MNAEGEFCGYIARFMKIYGTIETAKLLGVTEGRIRALIKAGILSATKVGRDWVLAEEEVLRATKTPRPPGRPRKNS